MNTQTASPRVEVDIEHDNRLARDNTTGEWGIWNKNLKVVLFNREMGQALGVAMEIFERSVLPQAERDHGSTIIMPGSARWRS